MMEISDSEFLSISACLFLTFGLRIIIAFRPIYYIEADRLEWIFFSLDTCI